MYIHVHICLNSILHPVLEDLKKLVHSYIARHMYIHVHVCLSTATFIDFTFLIIQECGFVFQGNGMYYGSLTIFLADNLASNAVGGFKESSSALRHCRQCLGTNNEMRSQVHCV